MLKHILVTGGSGYIGSHTVKILLKNGYKVTVYDKKVDHGRKLKGVEYFEADLLDQEKLASVFAENTFDGVFHFAALALVEESESKPEIYYRNNLVGTLNLLDAMIKKRTIPYLIFSSTCSVYGNPEALPITEKHQLAPVNTYGLTKKKIEEAFYAYAKAHNIKFSILRYFNVAGADESGELGEYHDPETHLIPLIFNAIGPEKHVKIFGTDYATADGTAIRDYIHVNDIADAHIKALECLENGGGNECFNLGSNKGFSVKEIIDMVRKVTGKNFDTVEAPRRAGDPAALVASSDKARSVLGWEPTRDLESIISSAWKFHQKLPTKLPSKKK